MKFFDREQWLALRTGGLILLAFAAGIVLIWVAGYLPGTVGRTFSLITGMLWTPTIMEPVLAVAALMAILILNHYRRQREGSEFVYLETVDGPAASQLPAESRAVTFADQPQPPSGEEVVAVVEGLVAMGDFRDAQRLMLELPPQLLEEEAMLAVRLQMAYHNEDPNHVRGLSRKLADLNPDHPALQQS
ncbi:hypothetical protein [Roseibacillus ishigakijimensis]|uniref:Uncharacterized protein n=1 Tax=Roseibacillus ishigakijimensis TaxID=454146 RepID=A0A934RQ48_9BACT|nr:hypothetical protein [Roseibacillus ishigakijimensis]MBK1833802.1 hypothetical protein [Roseibacillus ishigakijimensis]